MKTTKRCSIIVLCAVGGMALVGGNAEAQINIVEREQVQSIVWVVEFTTIVIFIAIAWLVWRISKRDYKNKKSKQDNS